MALLTYDHWRRLKCWEFIGYSKSQDTRRTVLHWSMRHVTLIIRWNLSISVPGNDHEWRRSGHSPQLWSLASPQTLRVYRIFKVTGHMKNGFTVIHASCDFDHSMKSQYQCARQWSWVKTIRPLSSIMIIGVASNAESLSDIQSHRTHEERFYSHSCVMWLWSFDEISVSVRTAMIMTEEAPATRLNYDPWRRLKRWEFIGYSKSQDTWIPVLQSSMRHVTLIIRWNLRISGTPMIMSEEDLATLLNYDHWRRLRHWEIIGWSKSHDVWMTVKPLVLSHVTLIIRWTVSTCAHANGHKWGEPCDTPHLWPLQCAQILRDNWVTKDTWHMNNGFNRHPCVMWLWSCVKLSVFEPMPMIIIEQSLRILFTYDHCRRLKRWESIGWSKSHDTWLIVQPLVMCHVSSVNRWSLSVWADDNDHKWAELPDYRHLWSLACAQILRDRLMIKVTWRMDVCKTVIHVACVFDHPMNSQCLSRWQWS